MNQKRFVSIIIIAIVCLVLLGGGFLFLRKLSKEGIVNTNLPLSESSPSGSGKSDNSVCGRIKRAVLDQRRLLEIGKKVAPDVPFESKIVFESDRDIPTQFPQAHFPVMPGLKLCYSQVTENPDEDTGMEVVSEIYYSTSSSVDTVVQWYEKNIKTSDVNFKQVDIQGSDDVSQRTKSVYGSLAMPMFSVTKGNYGLYSWETGCCSPDQPFDEWAGVYISLDEESPAVLFSDSKRTFYYRE